MTTSSVTDQINKAYSDGYAAGLRDAKDEHDLEKIHSGNATMDMMLAHETVMLCPEAGRAPFEFKPYKMQRYEKCFLAERDERIAPHTVGIYGLNVVTGRNVFYVRVDHWTLCPR